jgi:hypothetical protein
MEGVKVIDHRGGKGGVTLGRLRNAPVKQGERLAENRREN